MAEVIFYDGGCANCQQVAAFFSRHGIDHVRKNVKAHPELGPELERERERITTLPCVVVNGQRIFGWDEPGLRRALGLS